MAVRVYQGSSSYPTPSPGPVVTIGNFDGVHRGHRVLIDAAVARARSAGVPACVYTFDPAPRDVLRPDNDIPRIQSLGDKIAALGNVGIDEVVVEPFDRGFAANEAEWFAREILGRRLGASALVVGWDFRFGRGRKGTVPLLREWLALDVEQVPAFKEADGTVVSSSAIRQAVRAGRVGEATRWMGRPHRIRGEVVHGDELGRKLGFPTANVAPTTRLLPAFGVYAVRMDTGDGVWRPGMANHGVRPTVTASDEARLEVHLFDFAGDIYGQQVQVELVARLRDEQSFEDVAALRAQLARDAQVARARLA